MGGGFQTGFENQPKFNAGGSSGFQTGFEKQPPAQASAPKKGGGGFFGSIGHVLGGAAHFVGSKAALAGHDIAAMPGGAYHAGGALIHDVQHPKNLVHLGLAGAEASQGQFRSAQHQANESAFGKKVVLPTIGSTIQSIRHPLRDPFQTALTVAPIVGTVGKVAEAGIAAKAADVAAGESRLGEAGRALVRTHGNEPVRTLKSGGRVVKSESGATMRIGQNVKDTNLIPSRNAGVRLMQRGYDKALQNAMDKEAQAQGTGRLTARIASHAKGRIGGGLAEEQRSVERMNAIPADALERSALKLSKLPLKAGGKLHSAAMELTSTQTAPEDAALYHEQQAATLHEQAQTEPDQKIAGALGDAAKRNEGVAKLYRRVAKHDLVHVDETRPDGEKVFINPEKSKLAAADAALAQTGRAGEGIIQKRNVMSLEGQQERINAPAKVRAGAEYNAPTPGKLGIESPTLTEARSQLDKAEKLFAKVKVRAMGKIGNSRSVMHEFASRPMTDEEAQARLAALDKEYGDLSEKLVPHVSPLGGKDAKIEQLRRNEISGKLAKGKTTRGAAKPLETVKQENLRLADEKLREMAQKHAGNGKPWADAIANLIHERDTLRKTLQSRADAPIFGHEAPELPHVAGSGYKYELPWMRDPEVQRFAGHISILKDKVQRLEALHHGRIEPTGLVGGEEALPGRNFVGYRSSEKAAMPSQLSVSQGRTIGEAQSPIDKKVFTGENIRQGNIPKNTALSAAKHYRQLAKFENTASLRDAILEHDGSPVKRSPRDILIRVPDGGAKPLTEEMKQALGDAHKALHDQASLDEIHAGTREGLAALHQWFAGHILDQEQASKAAAVGTRAQKGYAWVDSRLAEQLQKDAMPRATGPKTLVGKAFDNTNSAVTAMTVYFKVGHAFTRTFTNAATNIMQGSARPDEFGKSIQLWKALSPTDRARLVAAAGQQGFAALPHEGSEGLVGRAISGAARAGARGWARYADRPFRFNALAYELRKVGYSTPEEVSKALDAIQSSGKGLPAHEWSKITAATRRADREAISYDRLNETEKKYLARAIWFYPWVKGSSMFAIRSIAEHPFKSAALGALGAQGRKVQEQELGPVPSYEQGLIPLTGGAKPLTADMSTFSPGATLGQLLNVPEVRGSIAQQFNPALAAGTQYAFGLDQYGGPSNNPVGDALSSLVSPTPEAQIADAIKRSHQNQAGRMFPGMTPGAEAKRYLLGPGLAFRRVNKAALAKAAAREHQKRYTVYSGG